MATTTYGTPYVSGTDLVANWPAASLTVANSIDAAGYYIGRGTNTQTASYTLILTDAGKVITMALNTNTTITIPTNSSVAFPIGTQVNLLNLGSGLCTPTAAGGVTIAGTITALAINGFASLIKTGTNTWSYMPPGGFPASATATVATSQTTSTLTFTDLATAGPAVTVTTGTKALVTVTAFSQGGGNGQGASMGFAVSGATTVAAADTSAFRNEPNGGGVMAPAIRYSATNLITGLTAGSNVFTAKYKALSGGAAEFKNRDISVIDLGS